MKVRIAKGSKEEGIVIGNAFDKYGSRNPIVKMIMSGFHRSLNSLIEQVRPTDLHEVGCGEGYWTLEWHQKGIKARGSDFSSQVIAMARENAAKLKITPTLFSVKSIYALEKAVDHADLVVCCEVLEHLDDPHLALKSLQQIADRYLIISVPREPIWRVLNVLRGKYLSDLGNTPGHIKHWNSEEIRTLVANYFEVVDILRPFPWTMILCKKITTP